MVRPLAVVAFLLGTASAQNLTAHPQETVQNWSGNFVPLGIGFFQAGTETRTQLLIPRHELPPQVAVLIGVEFHALPAGPAGFAYSLLGMDVGATSATQLGPDLDGNLPAPPTNVLPYGPATVVWPAATWVRIDFPNPYVHDGQSSLVLDIRKIVAAASTPLFAMGAVSTPPRTDRPLMVFANGNPGSGGAFASTATAAPQNAISCRLVWAGVPTLRNRADAASSGNFHGLGSTTWFTLQGNANELWALAAGTAFTTPAVLPGVGGELLLAAPVVFAAGALGATATASYGLAIPNVPGLVNLYVPFQAATIDPATSFVSLTNGVDLFVNS